MARMISASVHIPRPVSLSGVILGTMAMPNPSSMRKPPLSGKGDGAPAGARGVWQLPQAPKTSTRYWPLSTMVVAWACHTILRVTRSIYRIVRIMTLLIPAGPMGIDAACGALAHTLDGRHKWHTLQGTAAFF